MAVRNPDHLVWQQLGIAVAGLTAVSDRLVDWACTLLGDLLEGKLGKEFLADEIQFKRWATSTSAQ